MASLAAWRAGEPAGYFALIADSMGHIPAGTAPAC
jgi:hypothetical protein